MKKSKILFSVLMSCCFFFVSCDLLEEGDEEQKDIITGIETSDLSLEISGSDNLVKVVDFYATQAWSISINETTKADSDSWVSVSPMSGEAGESQITITISKNSTEESRSATVSISTAGLDSPIEIKLTQSAGESEEEPGTGEGEGSGTGEGEGEGSGSGEESGTGEGEESGSDSDKEVDLDSPTINGWDSDDESLDVEITNK
ncbi:MAG: BACON domain-containing protein [Rikenellaceae bacterium]